MAILATVNRSISFSPSFPGVSGSSQSAGGTTTPIIALQGLAYPAGSVNVVLAIVFPYATLQQIMLWSDKGMTLKFNSSGSPVPQIVLQPGSPFEWNSSDAYFSNPFTANITTCYVSCTPSSRLQGYVLCS